MRDVTFRIKIHIIYKLNKLLSRRLNPALYIVFFVEIFTNIFKLHNFYFGLD